MRKKGALHVDWVISMGIFLIYIFALFIFLRPTLTPITPQETISDTIIKELNQEATFTIKRIPLFLKTTTQGTNVTFPFNYPGGYNLIDENNSPIGFTIVDSKIVFDAQSKNKFWILNSAETISSESSTCTDCPGLDESQYSYGATEKITGLSKQKLTALQEENLKEVWNIPEQNEFSILIKNEADNYLNYESRPKEQEFRIFVREYKDHIIDPNTGLRKEVIINVGVW